MADPSEVYVDGYMTGETSFGLDATDPSFQRFLVYSCHRRLDAMERMVGSVGPLLDVGAGTGDLLVAARDRGIEAIGVEPVEASARLSAHRGVEVRNAMLEDSGLPESSYRTVTAFHVLEHMADGLAFLRLLKRWVEPGGHVITEVPNWRSMERRLKGRDWPGLRPLEHLAHYGPATLRSTFERAGLVDVQVRTLTFQWPEQSLRYALSDLGLRRVFRSKLVRPLSVERVDNGETVRYPKPAMRWAIRGTARMYDAAKVGQVVLAVGRRPAR
jgi:SAM-dependent methyltransferase